MAIVTVFPSIHDDLHTAAAVDWLSTQPVNIVQNQDMISKARDYLADALYVFAKKISDSNLCMLYLYDLTGSGDAWGEADGLFSQNHELTAGVDSYSVIGLSVQALQQGRAYFISCFIHELSHLLQAASPYSPTGNLPHDDVFSLTDESLQAYYYQFTKEWIEDKGYIR